MNGHEAVVRSLLTTNIVKVEVANIQGRTPLLPGTKSGREAVIKLLLLINRTGNNRGLTSCQMPLECAVENGHEIVVKLLGTYHTLRTWRLSCRVLNGMKQYILDQD